jgi:NADPH:quinone reductase-like Zn-dependent oxidoreductase
MAQDALPETMKAVVLQSTEQPPTIETVPTPQPTLGSAVVRVLAANTISYMRDIFNGKRNYPFPMPLTPGSSFIGRVVAVGLDATKMKAGDLVFVDCLIRSRDNPSDVYLAALHEGFTEGSRKLMRDVFRDWAYAEYCRTPLENLTLLDEARLTSPQRDGGLGYSLARLGYISALLVPYGGLRDIELRAGQKVIVAPATG